METTLLIPEWLDTSGTTYQGDEDIVILQSSKRIPMEYPKEDIRKELEGLGFPRERHSVVLLKKFFYENKIHSAPLEENFKFGYFPRPTDPEEFNKWWEENKGKKKIGGMVGNTIVIADTEEDWYGLAALCMISHCKEETQNIPGYGPLENRKELIQRIMDEQDGKIPMRRM